MENKYFKCLTPELKSFYDKETTWIPGVQMPEIKTSHGNNETCGIGYHFGLSEKDAISYAQFPFKLFTAIPSGTMYGSDSTKARFSSGMIVDDITPKFVKKLEDNINNWKNIKYFSKFKPVRRSWKHFGSRDAARAAARVAAGDAAWAAAWDAAGDAAGVAARAAARVAARVAAGDAARAATRAAARVAAWAAAWDAELMNDILLVIDLVIDKKHVIHAKKRMDVWERGYGLLCDIGGTLYTYDKP